MCHCGENDHIFENRMMIQASTLEPNKHKRRRLRYLGEIKCEVISCSDVGSTVIMDNIGVLNSIHNP